MAVSSESDPLFDIKCALYIGNYQQCINEAQKLKVCYRSDYSVDVSINYDVYLLIDFQPAALPRHLQSMTLSRNETGPTKHHTGRTVRTGHKFSIFCSRLTAPERQFACTR